MPPKSPADVNAAERNGRKTLTTVQGLPKKFDQKKILKVIKKKFACNGTIVNDTEMGEVIQLQGDQRKDVQEFLVDKKEGLGLDTKDIKVSSSVGCFVGCVLTFCRSMVSKRLYPSRRARLQFSGTRIPWRVSTCQPEQTYLC